MLDEKANTAEALPVLKADIRLDFYKRKDSVIFPPAEDMLRKKLEILDHEVNEFLPGVAHQFGLDTMEIP